MYESMYFLLIKCYTFLNVYNVNFFQYITVHIDVNLQNQGYSEQIISEIQSTDVKYKIESNTSVSHSVTWSRQIVNNYFKFSNSTSFLSYILCS
jgi:hypothetical protein